MQDTFRNVMDGVSEEFIIDKSLGRDIKFTLDDLHSTGTITKIQLLDSNGTAFYDISGDIGGTLSINLGFLEVSLGLSF